MSFSKPQKVRLGDVTSQGRVRLDAIARYLQDIAADDAAHAHLPDGRGWILRRMNFDIGRLPTIYEDLVLETFPTGVGGRWAERTTTLVGIDGLNAARTALKSGVLVTATAVWVYVRLDTGAPVALPLEFFVAYGEAVRERKVSARLTHPAPPPDAKRVGFPLRGTDFDVFGHVNNAIYWVPVEEFMATEGSSRRLVNATIEFGGGIQPGERCDVATTASETDVWMWFLVGDDVRSSIRVGLAP